MAKPKSIRDACVDIAGVVRSVGLQRTDQFPKGGMVAKSIFTQIHFGPVRRNALRNYQNLWFTVANQEIQIPLARMVFIAW